jgi:DNA adenine methylase
MPPIPYYGGKTRMAPTIAALLPEHRHYVEPFAGSLAVLLAKPRAEVETVNDLDGEVVNFWRVVRDHPAELANLCEFTPHSREEFELAEPPYPRGLTDLERARRFFVHLTQGKMHTTRPKTGWRHTRGRMRLGRSFREDVDRFYDRIREASGRIQDIQIEHREALDMIGHYGGDPDVLIYADPPYLGLTRSGGVDAPKDGHRIDMATLYRHDDLLTALKGCRAAVVLSGWRSPHYEQALTGWYAEEFAMSSAIGGAGKPTAEVLWSNRPLGGRHQPTLFEEGE